jgi:hypothetical protein
MNQTYYIHHHHNRYDQMLPKFDLLQYYHTFQLLLQEILYNLFSHYDLDPYNLAEKKVLNWLVYKKSAELGSCGK